MVGAVLDDDQAPSGQPNPTLDQRLALYGPSCLIRVGPSLSRPEARNKGEAGLGTAVESDQQRERVEIVEVRIGILGWVSDPVDQAHPEVIPRGRWAHRPEINRLQKCSLDPDERSAD